MVLVVLIATLTFAPVASAHTFGSCTNPITPGNSVVVYENQSGDFSDGNDKWWAICHAGAPFGYPDLRQISTDPYDCHAGILPKGTWNDCISSVQYWLATSLWRFCFYRDLTYSQLSYWVQGPADGVRVNIAPNDDATSMRLRNDGTC